MTTSNERGHELLKSKEKYPPFNQLDYNLSVHKNLNFYSIEVDDLKKKKEWALSYWKSQGKSTSGLGRLPDGAYHTVGAVAHMIHVRGIDLHEKELLYCEKKYKELFSLVKEEKEVIVDEHVVKQDKDFLSFMTHMAEFDAGVDLFFSGHVFDAKSYLIKHAVKGTVTKQIATTLKPLLAELKEAAKGDDEQLVEAYSHLTKRQLTKFIDYVAGLISSCDIASAINKAAKTPKATKIKSPIELTKKVQYLKEDPVSKLKSEHPSKIVHAGECWIYNTKTRRLNKYVALSGNKLTVKGMSIINVDVEKSASKIIRKPETQLIEVQSLTSSKLGKFFSSIKGSESKVASRISDECIIVKCFN